MRRKLWLQLALLASLPVWGYLYEWLASNFFRQTLKMPGKWVTLGVQTMRVDVQGENHAGATVILESGAGGFAPEWRKLQTQIAQFARVISYDRAGHGWSDEGAQPRTPQQIAAELHALLPILNLPPPYIYVGQSLGGIYALAFGTLFPHDMAGVVLVDASHPKMHTHPEINLTGELENMRRGHLKAKWGWQRLTSKNPDEGHFANLPPDLMRAYVGLRPRSVATMYHEVRATWAINPVQYQLGDIPLRVLTRTPSDSQLSPIWQQLQKDLLTYSTHSTQVIAKKAGHDLHLDAPELVLDAVRELHQMTKPIHSNGAVH
jgi:pimeloyl-ACP methyl ester carboxylesterase